MTILSSENFDYNGVTVRVREQDQWINLTDLWKAAGSTKNKDTREWLRLPSTLELVEELKQNRGKSPVYRTGSERDFQNQVSNQVYEVRRGRGGGTFATRELALEYASYLSVEMRAWLLRVGVERIEEDASPDPAYTRGRDRAVSGWQQQGLSTEEIYERIDWIEDELRENYEEIEDPKLPGDDMYLPYGVN